MCPPTYFEVAYNINPWMNGNVGYKSNQQAQTQWRALYDAISSVTEVKLVDPVEGLPDMVFTANAGLSVNGKVFLSNFKHAERKGEEYHFEKWFLDNDFHVVKQTQNLFEGEGDCLLDADGLYWMGFGFRSDEFYANVLWKFGVNARTVNLVDKRFYHIDTCFCPLPDGSLMYYPEAFDVFSQMKIESYFHKLGGKDVIRVSEKEAETFCCNAVVIDRNIFMPECSTVADVLSSRGFNVQEFNMSEFQKSGGACKCLVMNL